MRIIGTLSCSLLALWVLPSCGTTVPRRYTCRQNERVVTVEDSGKRIWMHKSYTFRHLSISNQRSRLAGSVTEKVTTAKETLRSKVKEYDLVTKKRRQRYVIEYQLLGVNSDYPQRVLILPLGIAAGIVALPFELVVGHGMAEKSFADVPNYVEEGMISREKKREQLPSHSRDLSGYETVERPGSGIPVVMRSSDVGLGGEKEEHLTLVTDSEGRVDVPIALPPESTTAEKARKRAYDRLLGILVSDKLAQQFAASLDYVRKKDMRIDVRTDAKSLVDRAHAKSEITEGEGNVTVRGVYFSEPRLLEGLADHLRSIALAHGHPTSTTVSIAVKDNASHTDVSGDAEVEADFVAGVTRQTIRKAMAAELRKYVKPPFIGRYLPSESKIPEMLRLPSKFRVGEARTFRIHVPARFRMKITHPEYLFVQGEKEFTEEDRSAVVYMEDKGSKHRVVIEKGQKGGKIE